MPIFRLLNKLHSEERGAETSEWIGSLAVLLIALIALSLVFDQGGTAIGQGIVDQVGCKISTWTGGSGSCASGVTSPSTTTVGAPDDGTNVGLLFAEETAEEIADSGNSNANPAQIVPSASPVSAGFINFPTDWWEQIQEYLEQLNSTPPPDPNELLTHDEALQILSSGGITEVISSGGCSDASQGNCTSFDGVRRESLQGLIDFKAKCDQAMGDCDIHMTGGTETGHSNGTYSHSNGHKLDFRSSFNGTSDNFAGQYIKANFTPVTDRGQWGDAYEDPDTGYLYVYEDSPPHWDVCFSKDC